MKIRTGFVSNSSSSSFTIYRLYAATNDRYMKELVREAVGDDMLRKVEKVITIETFLGNENVVKVSGSNSYDMNGDNDGQIDLYPIFDKIKELLDIETIEYKYDIESGGE